MIAAVVSAAANQKDDSFDRDERDPSQRQRRSSVRGVD
jgi:hypothetical protein